MMGIPPHPRPSESRGMRDGSPSAARPGTVCLNVEPHVRHEWVAWTGQRLVCPGVAPKGTS